MQEVRASVWPHGHSAEFGGPVDVAIGVRSQPALLRKWDTKQKPYFQIEQPDQNSNFSLIRVFFGDVMPTRADLVGKWNNANVYRKTDHRRQVDEPTGKTDDKGNEIFKTRDIDPGAVIVVNIKGRYTNQLTHPLPVGKYRGTCEEGEGWVLFTLQARTLVRQSVTQKSNILQPGDFEYQKTKEALGDVTPSGNQIIVP